MNSTQTLLSPEPRIKVAAKSKPDRWFYSGVAALILVFMFVGFQQYYLYKRAFPGREIAQPLKSMIFAHAATMTAWVVLSLVQPLLIASRNYRVHMRLGWIGAALAASIAMIG